MRVPFNPNHRYSARVEGLITELAQTTEKTTEEIRRYFHANIDGDGASLQGFPEREQHGFQIVFSKR